LLIATFADLFDGFSMIMAKFEFKFRVLLFAQYFCLSPLLVQQQSFSTQVGGVSGEKFFRDMKNSFKYPQSHHTFSIENK
jgi:hypothetical protein